MRHEVTTRRVLYEIPGMKSVRVEQSTFPGANGEPLPLEIYAPVNPIGDCVVAMVEGYPSAGFEKHMGCTFMEMEWTISMAQLIAASGMTAVTHSNREAEPDALALMKHLGAKYRKVGLWATSGHGPLALVVERQEDAEASRLVPNRVHRSIEIDRDRIDGDVLVGQLRETPLFRRCPGLPVVLRSHVGPPSLCDAP